jgi:excisionase family DNA binding protein
MTTVEAAEFLGLHAQTLRAWARDPDGKGPRAVRVSANRTRYRRRDLEAFVEERTGSVA